MLSRLQYISQGATQQHQLHHIRTVLDAGCTWVQLRFKQADAATFRDTAMEAKRLCDAYGATFIINDHVNVAREVDASGVHVGLSDTPVREARQLLGSGKIIGGTANTIDDVWQRVEEQCDYIGLGPFRFTSTKEKLSPILGAQGYRQIMETLAAKGIQVPVIAIGGILEEDMEDIMETGVHGIAVSGLLTNATAPDALIRRLELI